MFSGLFSAIRSMFSRPVAPAPAPVVVVVEPPAPVVVTAPAPVEPPPPAPVVVVESPASPPPPPVVVEPPAPIVPPPPAPVVVVVTAPRPPRAPKAPKAPKADGEGESLIPPCEGAYDPDHKGVELVQGLWAAWSATLAGDRAAAEVAFELVHKGCFRTMIKNAVSGSLWNRFRSNQLKHGRGHAERLPTASQSTGEGKFFANTENGMLSIEAASGVTAYLLKAWDKRVVKGNLSCPFEKLAEDGALNYTALGFLAGAAANYLSEIVNGNSRGYTVIENADGTTTTKGIKKAEYIGERETVSREPEPGFGLEGRDTRAQKRWVLGQVLADADRKLVKAWALQTAGARVGGRRHDEKVRTKPETVYGKSRATTQRRLEEFREVIKEALGADDKLESSRVALRMAQLLSIGL